MNSADRLLAAEKQFSELAEQLQKLKSAAQAIEQAGHATGQMRALAESAIATASSLGEKIGRTTEVIEKQNIPERLRENESRLNTKFLELRDLTESAIATTSSLGEKVGYTAEVIERQNIPERLRETESRLTANFLELKELESASIGAAERDAQTKRDMIIELKGLVSTLETRVVQGSERFATTIRQMILLQVLLAALLACLILNS